MDLLYGKELRCPKTCTLCNKCSSFLLTCTKTWGTHKDNLTETYVQFQDVKNKCAKEKDRLHALCNQDVDVY